MADDNIKKAQEIKKVLERYKVRMSDLRKRRDKAISKFLDKVRDKKIQEIRDEIKKYG